MPLVYANARRLVVCTLHCAPQHLNSAMAATLHHLLTNVVWQAVVCWIALMVCCILVSPGGAAGLPALRQNNQTVDAD